MCEVKDLQAVACLGGRGGGHWVCGVASVCVCVASKPSKAGGQAGGRVSSEWSVPPSLPPSLPPTHAKARQAGKQ